MNAEGTPLPNELKAEVKLRDEVRLEDDNTAIPRDHIDDEYARAGEIDPIVCITTSRNPSSRLAQFSKVQLLAMQMPIFSVCVPRISSVV